MGLAPTFPSSVTSSKAPNLLTLSLLSVKWRQPFSQDHPEGLTCEHREPTAKLVSVLGLIK